MNKVFFSLTERRYNTIIFIAILTLLFILKFPVLNLPYHWDATALMKEAHWVKEDNFIPFRCYRFPVFSELLALCWFIFGDHLWVSHSFNIFVTSAGLYFTYLLGKLIYNNTAGLIAAGLLFFCPLYFAQAGIMNFSILLTTLNVATIYFVLRRKTGWYLFAATLLVLTKEEGCLTIIAALLYIFYEWLQFKRQKVDSLNFNLCYPCICPFSVEDVTGCAYILARWKLSENAGSGLV